MAGKGTDQTQEEFGDMPEQVAPLLEREEELLSNEEGTRKTIQAQEAIVDVPEQATPMLQGEDKLLNTSYVEIAEEAVDMQSPPNGENENETEGRVLLQQIEQHEIEVGEEATPQSRIRDWATRVLQWYRHRIMMDDIFFDSNIVIGGVILIMLMLVLLGEAYLNFCT